MIDYAIVLDRGIPLMDFAAGDSLLNVAYNSLTMRRGSWFADLSFGSRCHLIKKATAQSVKLYKAYCEEALQWLVDYGKVKSVVVTAELVNGRAGWFKVVGTLTKFDNQNIPFSYLFPIA